jgi:hypothetical protein
VASGSTEGRGLDLHCPRTASRVEATFTALFTALEIWITVVL